ncbi:MAG: GntR family transcriptional regulator [Microbacterium sp.]|uniref:GntR family transcriptional regulator n=1 Tax=Microbacterium sp. TaxID=51671 RepID=UPI003F9C6913
MVLHNQGAISRSSISEQVEESIRQMVLDGTLKAGERLNEVALAEAMGISRGPLREAIRKLSGEGLLSTGTHRGAFVKRYEPQEIIDFYELRAALELYSIKLTIRRASDEHLQELAEHLAQDQARNTNEASSIVAMTSGPYVAELDFHQQLASLSGNKAIQEHLADINHKLYLALRSTTQTSSRKETTVNSHYIILDAVRARDVETSMALLTDHLNDSMRNSLQVMGLLDKYELAERVNEIG